MEDPYALLKIRRDATQDEVKRAHRRLAQEFHPDVNHDPRAQEQFKKITWAYSVLSHKGKRRMYDQGFDPFTGRPLNEEYPPPTPPPTPPKPPWSPRRPRRTSKVFSGLAATAVLAVIAGVIFIIVSPAAPASSAATTTPQPFTQPPAQASATAQAAQINDLLNATAVTTKPLIAALHYVSECRGGSSVVGTIKAVADRYRAEYYRASSLNTGQLPNGAALKNDLINALASSAWADLYFVEWAQQREAPGCAGLGAAAYNKAAAYAAKANAAKESFVHLWNPITSSDRLPSRSAGDI